MLTGRTLKICELHDPFQKETYSSDEEIVGFDQARQQWIPQLPKQKNAKLKGLEL